MEGGTLALIEMLLVFGLVVGFGVWQLVSVRRSIREDEEKRRPQEAEAAQAARDSTGNMP